MAVLLLLTASLLMAQLVQAQSLTLPAVIEFDHDGRGVKGFVLYATRTEDGTQKRIDVGMPTKAKSGRMQIGLPPLPNGTWRLELAAYNAAGESPRAKADPSEVRLDDAPSKPPPSAKASPEPKPAPKSPAGVHAPPPPQKKAPPPPKKRKGGALGKLWRVIVGDDGP